MCLLEVSVIKDKKLKTNINATFCVFKIFKKFRMKLLNPLFFFWK